MLTIFIFHGIGGHPAENWFPWLKTELEKEDMNVIVPTFPRPDTPDLQVWLDYFAQYQPQVDENTIFIGHSLGGAFALRLLERLDHPIKAVFLVASVSGVMGNQFDPVMTTFNVPPYDWSTIKSNAGTFYVIHGDNDPYITLALAEGLASTVGVSVDVIPGGGHLNASAGYTQFEHLLDLVRTSI